MVEIVIFLSPIIGVFCGAALAIGETGAWLWLFAVGGEILALYFIGVSILGDNLADSDSKAAKVMCILGTIFWIIGLKILIDFSDSENDALVVFCLACLLIAPYLIVASLYVCLGHLPTMVIIGIAKVTSSFLLYFGNLEIWASIYEYFELTFASFVIVGLLALLSFILTILKPAIISVSKKRKRRKEEVQKQRRISYSNRLIFAAGNDDKSEVLDMLDLGADVNYENSDGKTPLLNATINDNLDVASILIDKGADVNCKDSSEQTPLLFAAKNSNKDMVSLLWKRGANINSRNSSGKVALDYAIENENEDLISFLLENGADIGNDDSNINNLLDFAIKNDKDNLLSLLAEKAAKDDIYCEEKPILFFAIENNYKKFVELLIKKGVHKKSRYSYDEFEEMTPLLFAVKEGNKEAVLLLLKNKAEVNMGVKLNTYNIWIPPLGCAVINSNKEIASILIDNGADVNYDGGGLSPLEDAIKKNDKDMASFLIEKGANLDCGSNGQTPLFVAISDGNKEMISFLLDKGADINYVVSVTVSKEVKSFLRKQKVNTKLTNSLSSYTKTVLSEAIDSHNEEMVSFLIEKGADVNLEVSINNGNEEYSYTMLQKAIHIGNKKIISLLLDAGADINQNSQNAGTALMTAVDKKNYNPEIVSLLIEKGANVNLEIKNGETPLTLAVSQNNKDAALLLLKNGADPNKKDPLMGAFLAVNREMISLLMQNGADPCAIFGLAAAMPTTDAAQFLLDNGADVNSNSLGGNSPLTSAICFGQKEMALFLISNGADVNYEKSGDPSDKTGARTPLECAIVTGNVEMVSLLLTYGADANHKCQNGNTPLLFAARHQRTELVPILKKAGATSFIPIQNARPSSISSSSANPSNSDLSENSADFNSALVALSKIIAKNGVEIFTSQNSKKLNAFISDLIPQENEIAVKLKQAFSCDFAQIILDANDKSDVKKEKAFNKAVDKIIVEANLEKGIAVLIVKLLALSLEWDLENLNLQ